MKKEGSILQDKQPGPDRPRILVTNDDGITSEGIRALEQALAEVGDVYAVAPMREMSASSHSISLRRSVSYIAVDPQRWAVDGTPADCVILALHTILGFLPDLVFSGINPGGNLGRNIFYSGTLAAAVEGSLHGVPGVSVSLCSGAPYDFSAAANLSAQLAARLLEERLPAEMTLNMNVPAQWNGAVRITRMGRSEAEGLQPAALRPSHSRAADVVEPDEPESPADHRLTTHGAAWRPLYAPESDYAAVRDGAVSLTPLLLDRTHYAALDALESCAKALATLAPK